MTALRLRREHAPEEGAPRASAGQVLVLFALMSTALFGILGLSVDIGYAVSQRRAMQNTADLAAIAGAHAIAEYREGVNEVPASTSIEAVLKGNQTAEGPAGVRECVYVDDDFSPHGECERNVPELATGVRVEVQETHRTFFIQVVPGVDPEVTTSARATARVELLFRPGMDAPFIVCGYGTKLADGSGEQSILLDDKTVHPDAIGKTFRIVGDNTAVFNPDPDGDGIVGRDPESGKQGEEAANQSVAERRSGDPVSFDPTDTDDGGVQDGAEVIVYDTEPNVAADDIVDGDGDGLTDLEEDVLGTDPAKRDTDGGGRSDWSEVQQDLEPFRDTDPLDDSDDDIDTDGLTDYAEINEHGTVPNNRDTDDGGLSDWAELEADTDPIGDPSDNEIDSEATG